MLPLNFTWGENLKAGYLGDKAFTGTAGENQLIRAFPANKGQAPAAAGTGQRQGEQRTKA